MKWPQPAKLLLVQLSTDSILPMTIAQKFQKPTSVFLIEDRVEDADLIAQVISQESRLNLVGTASTIREAAKFLAQHKVQVVLFDLILQQVERSQDITALKRLAPKAKFLVLTAYEETDRIFRALCAGAHGYLLKSDDDHPLPAAILETLEYGSIFSPSVATVLAQYFNALGEEQREAQSKPLTVREEQVLRLLCRGLTNKEIAKELEISISMVKKHMAGICSKLEVENRTEAAAKARRWLAW